MTVDAETLRQFAAEGKTLIEAAEHFGVAYSSMPYWCRKYGVSRSVVYRMMSGGFDHHIERIRRKQYEPRPRTPCRSYKEALPPEQWDGARVLPTILKPLKGMGEKPQIDPESLRGVWQQKMAERC